MAIGAEAVQRDYACIPDQVIISRVGRGERDLFEVLMRRYNQRLFRVARGILRDDGLAEDVVQEAYVSAYLKLAQFSGRGSFSSWLTRIAVRAALARKRGAGRQSSVRDDAVHPDNLIPLKSAHSNPETEVESRQLRRFIEAAIEQLPEGAREVFVLRDVEELSTAETAACLDLTEEAVRVRLHRARTAMRADLARAIGDARREVYAFAGERCDRIVTGVLERLFTGDAA